MIQIGYQPAYDPYNTVFRVLRLLFRLKKTVKVGELRIFDFLMMFPQHIKAMRLTPPLRSVARKLGLLQSSDHEYGFLPDKHVLFDNMGPIFEAAVQTLVARGLVDTGQYGDGVINLVRACVPDELHSLAEKTNEDHPEVISFLAALHDALQYEGPNGLKG